MTRVFPIGPPFVATATVSKIWKEPIIETTTTMTRIGRISGSVIERNVRHTEAPSSCAASYTIVGTVCIPAKIRRAV